MANALLSKHQGMELEARGRMLEVLERARGRFSSQRQFAQSLGVQLNTVQQWLNGANVPALDKMPGLARVSGLSVTQIVIYVLFGEGEPKFVPLSAEESFNYCKELDREQKAKLVAMLAFDLADH